MPDIPEPGTPVAAGPPDTAPEPGGAPGRLVEVFAVLGYYVLTVIAA
jgi:hypothetical protein